MRDTLSYASDYLCQFGKNPYRTAHAVERTQDVSVMIQLRAIAQVLMNLIHNMCSGLHF